MTKTRCTHCFNPTNEHAYECIGDNARGRTFRVRQSFNGYLEANPDGHYYVLSVDKKISNRLDCFVTSFQLSVVRELGLPESIVR